MSEEKMLRVKDPQTTQHDQSLNGGTCSPLFNPQLLTVAYASNQ